MKRFLSLIFIFSALTASAQENTSKWFFGKNYNRKIETSWNESGLLKATDYGNAHIRVVKADGTVPEQCVIEKNRPVAGPIHTGDCIVMEFPESIFAAGSYVDFALTFAGQQGETSEWIFEYYDGGWKSGSVYKIYGTGGQPTSVLETVRLVQVASHGQFKMRMRALGNCSGIVFQSHAFLGAYAADRGTKAPVDTLKALYIGNSFTYYQSSPSLLKEIAWKEGHYIDMTTSLRGGATFAEHLTFDITEDAISEGGYDLAILQDHSRGPVGLGLDKKANSQYLKDAEEIADRIREASPECRFVIEYRSSATAKNDFYGCGSLKAYNKCTLRGTKMMAKAIGAEMSNITDAFMIVRRDRPDIAVLASDGTHPSIYGSYLKSCINYLTIYRKPFGDSPADCGLDPKKTSCLRSLAEQVVLGK